MTAAENFAAPAVPEALGRIIGECCTGGRRIGIAFSGGVDSAYLLYAAAAAAPSGGIPAVCAYFVKGPFQPLFELDDARRLFAELGARFPNVIEMRILTADPLRNETIAANPADRCYHCKRMIFSEIGAAALSDGCGVLFDGTNASDDAADRPGMRALAELGVRSPLREAGLGKSDIRALSRAAGLFTADKPSYACLATRVPTGERITRRKLDVTERAEGRLESLGLRDFRVRVLEIGAGRPCCSDKQTESGEDIPLAARIQVREEQAELVLALRKEIITSLKADYAAVMLDLEVRE